MKRLTLTLLGFVLVLNSVVANEGMWLPMFISRLNHTDMQKHGLQLTAEEIYSVNNSSLKDAIVMLSGGSCTAEIISKEGLTLTNHHCAFGAIQANSTVEHDYLADGFWAMSKDKELKTNLTASFLVRMEDVTETVLGALSDDMDEMSRAQAIAMIADSIETAVVEGTDYNADVKSFFEGNEFYLFVYETFGDVRLVGAPPSSVGKYGGDTDNWMWPRHTGDFSVLRVYTGKDGKPADYSEENIPLIPRHHLPVSMSGVNEGDYAMVMGYPGSTDRYLTSYGVRNAMDLDQPARVKIRGKKLEIMKEDMDADQAIRIQYASKYARVSNYWKYFIGQQEQVKNNGVYEKKLAEEQAFTEWAEENAERKEKYGTALDLIKQGYEQQNRYQLANTYLGEAIFGSEILLMGYYNTALGRALSAEEVNQEQVDAIVQSLRGRAEGFYKDYNAPTDAKVTAAMLEMYMNDVPEDQIAPELKDMVKKYKGDYQKLVSKMFSSSIFASKSAYEEFLNDPSMKALDKDMAYTIASGVINHYRGEIVPMIQTSALQLEKGNRLFVAGLREMQPNRKFYPNANSTMRVTYGNVLSYEPRDAVKYEYFTTLEGVMEKEDPTNPEFVVPAKLKELYEAKDYGQYADADDKLHVCFLTNNDITGGNSGSPVINGKGQLIGCAFDGNWEAMSGDIFFEENIQRTIVVDIRYVLFIMDKYAGAGHLVNEMTLVWDKEETEEVAEPVEETSAE